MEKIVLDTDIGSDIDDSFALAYLLNKPECNLLGITTVSGQADLRADLCQLYVQESKKKIPIYEGVSKPICFEELQPQCPQARILSAFPVQQHAPQGHAFEFLSQLILDNPHEITLLCIGPLTNLGLLFSYQPQLAPLLKRLVLMGCKVDNSPEFVGRLDWNVLCDPIATKIVLQAELEELVIFPCDVTYSLTSSPAYLDKQVKGKYRKLIKPMSEIWFEKFEGYSYHDPMVATYPFHPELVEVKRGTMVLDMHSSATLSYTHFVEDPCGKHLVVTHIDEQAFLQELTTWVNA